MQKVDCVGRVTIPKNLRKDFNLNEGNDCDIIPTDNGVLIVPKISTYSVGVEDMNALRKLYIMLKNSGFIDDYYDEILSKITKKTEINCTECGENLFLTTDNSYKCFKCE